MKVIIACAGPQKYWNNYLGVRSHFAPAPDFQGSPILARTISQWAATEPSEIVVTYPPTNEQDFVELLEVFREEDPEVEDIWDWSKLTLEPVLAEQNEYWDTRHLWSDTERTVLVLGDVFFSTKAVIRVYNDFTQFYRVYGRYGSSKITGTPYGEIFAASWYPAQRRLIEQACQHVDTAYSHGRIKNRSGWNILRSIQQTPLCKHHVDPKFFVEINDETDDVDKPEDYDRHPFLGAYRG